MRPKSVTRFEVLFLASMGLGLVIAAIHWEMFVYIHVGIEALLRVVVLLVMLVLVLLVSRRKSTIARGLLVGIFALGTLIYIPHMFVMLLINPISAGLAAIQVMLQAIALYFVHRADAEPWFSKIER